MIFFWSIVWPTSFTEYKTVQNKLEKVAYWIMAMIGRFFVQDPTRCLAMLRDRTLLQGSCWPFCLTQTKQNNRVYCLENIRFIVLLRFKEGCPHAILPWGSSSRKVLAVMPVVCKSSKRNNWVGTILIIKFDDNLPIYLHLN